MHHQRLPLMPLHVLACQFIRSVGLSRFCAIVDKYKWVRIEIVVGGGDLVDHGVFSNTAKPVLGVAKITFAAVHDTVPKAPFGRMQILAETVASVQITRQ
ncbi:hypothetical protein CA13_05640 [Planctomycetes bacterium CA13]|uniref:Uncharacterized protein n=1 Tax=Novipirellula herctigrandis TaxID=2527986 RepID=A0A5C5YWK5_9BACT|nr:hypothetical protein CA13_05640 [Planctomycetes bacterium CA13]